MLKTCDEQVVVKFTHAHFSDVYLAKFNVRCSKKCSDYDKINENVIRKLMQIKEI